MISSKTKIGLLVAGHFVVGLVSEWYANVKVSNFSLLGLVLWALTFSEAGLIGIWGGLSATRLAWRVPAVVAGTAYLWVLITRMQLRESTSLFRIIAFTAVTILVVLTCLGHSRRRLRMAQLTNDLPISEGFQFSIRHLLLATTAVAVVLASGKGIRSNMNPDSVLFEVTIFTPCFIMVELATLWAALGVGQPIIRLAFVLPLTFVVPMCILGRLRRPDWSLSIIWSCIFGLQAIITAASLLVIRSCGWRLVSGDRRTAVDERPQGA